MPFGPTSRLPPGTAWLRRRQIVTICAAVLFARTVSAQSGSMLRGRILDPSNAGIPTAVVHLDHTDTGVRTSVSADASGEYTVPALPLGDYRLEVSAPGFQTRVVGPVKLEVGRTIVLDLQLPVGAIVEEASATAPLVDLASVSVGQVIGHDAVQEIPLNGRHLLDLVALVPGTPTPPQNGFSTTPSRGLGALATLTGGSREDAVSFVINGVALNNQAFNSVPLQPSVEIVQEFKVDNSTFSAEFGQSAGAVVNIVTRSGANTWHGGLFDFLRDDSLDARNYFEVTSPRPAPFARYQFGGTLGGRIVRNRTFFFFSYEAVRQRQRLTLNSVVPTDAQRASVTNAVVARLLPFVPRVNFVDEAGLARYVGVADAEVSSRQTGLDVTHAVRPGSRIQGYYGENPVRTNEPNVRGNTIPDFGHTFQGRRHVATAAATQAVRAGLMNEVRVGFYHVNGTNTPNALTDPRDYGIRVGVDAAIGLPQMNIAGGALNVGGPNNFPNGRSDTTVVVADSMTYLRGRHALKAGGEYRRFFTDAFARDPGLFTFPSVDAFLSGVANAFSVTLGDRSSHIRQGALGGFAQDNFRLSPAVTLDLGLRVDWNMTPVERDNRFIVFDPASVSLLRVGTDVDQVYQQNYPNLQPRVGLAWDPFGDGRTAVRAAYAVSVSQPNTSAVVGTAAYPPFANPLSVTGAIPFDRAIDLARAAGLAPTTVDRGYENPSIQSWNVNVQRELIRGVVGAIGYLGSRGAHLRLSRNINQPIAGTRPHAALSASSPVMPGTPLGNITAVESSGASRYNGLWVSLNRRFSGQLQLAGSYTFSKSMDYNSLSSQGVVAQNSYDIRAEWAPSDYDARHRFVASLIYLLPFKGNSLIEGWEVAAVVQCQSGNPINIVVNNSALTGFPNTVRPDVSGPIQVFGDVNRWFDTSVFTAVPSFGNLPRNAVVGPRFDNTDVSLAKNLALADKVRLQLRIDVFDIFNHPNFGQPGNVVGSPTFGRITSTRFPTGESGSSRQIQVAARLSF